jgi:hypothetical protein
MMRHNLVFIYKSNRKENTHHEQLHSYQEDREWIFWGGVACKEQAHFRILRNESIEQEILNRAQTARTCIL